MSKKHTAIIYFHGIGTQRRHEEISRLLDAIDQYTLTQKGHIIGHPRGQKIKLESSRTSKAPHKDPVSYISFHRCLEPSPEEVEAAKKRKKEVRKKTAGYFRLYEGYWSPLIAKGLPPRKVLIWILKRSFNPITSLRASWRAHQRLKLGYLFRLQNEDSLGFSNRKSAYQEIANWYRKFEEWPARRAYPEGSLEQFRDEFLPKTNAGRRKDFALIQSLITQWQTRFRCNQNKILFGILTFLIGVLGVLNFVLFCIGPLISSKFFNIPYAEKIVANMPAQPHQALVISMGVVVVFGTYFMRRALRDYVSDVVFWTAKEGKSDLFEMHDEILNHAVDNLEHVLGDDNCERVVVIGHSLGSSIGYQALIEIGKRRKAMGTNTPEAKKIYPYEKITHFITAGSPIETIHYFFELTDSKHHRYNRIANDMKGSIVNPPFNIGDAPNIKWINMYAKADLISSQLLAPGKSKPPRIEEVEVVNQLEPSIKTAHSGYFTAITAVARLHDAIMLNDTMVSDPMKNHPHAKPIARLAVTGFHLLMTIAAWLVFLSAIFFWIKRPDLMSYGLYGFFGIIAFILLLWVSLMSRGRNFTLRIGPLSKR